MSYFPGMPSARPYSVDSYYDGYQGFGYYGQTFGTSYGPPYGSSYGPPRPYGSFGRGRSRGCWPSASGSGKPGQSGAGGTGGAAAAAAAVTTSVSAATAATEQPTDKPADAPLTTAALPALPAAASGTAITTTATTTTGATTTAGASTTTTVTTATTAAAADAGIKRKAGDALSEENPLPSSIKDKFFPDRCDLCLVVFPVARDIVIPEKGGLQYMDSNLQSTMHYSGKSHKKRLRQTMYEFCRANRLMVPRRAREMMKDTPAVPRAADKEETAKVDLYCKVCDLSFTSVQHASQHYAGKNHQRKVEGKPPLRTGFFNPRLGRWQRLPPEEQQEQLGLGLAFPVGLFPPAKPTVNMSVLKTVMDHSVVTVKVEPGNLVMAGAKPTSTASGGAGSGSLSKFHCEICHVSATCQLQLDTHINGSKHRLQAKKLGLPVPDPPSEPAAAQTDGAAANGPTSGAGQPPAKRPHKDYSIYKTPSGKFYCLPCNMTMNSETQFAQHFESKKHKSEVVRQRSTTGSAY